MAGRPRTRDHDDDEAPRARRNPDREDPSADEAEAEEASRATAAATARASIRSAQAEGKPAGAVSPSDDDEDGDGDTPGLDEDDANAAVEGFEILRPAFVGEPAINPPGITGAVVAGRYKDDEDPSEVAPGYYVVDTTTGGQKFREGPFPSSPAAEAHQQAHYGSSLQVGLAVAEYAAPVGPGELSEGEFPPREGFPNPNFVEPAEGVTPEEAKVGIGPL